MNWRSSGDIANADTVVVNGGDASKTILIKSTPTYVPAGDQWNVDVQYTGSGTVTVNDLDLLVLTSGTIHRVTHYATDVAGTGSTDTITLPSDGTIDKYVEAGSVDIKLSGTGVDTEYLTDVRTILPIFDASVTWDPGSIADGAMEAKEVDVPGAVLGDYAVASFSLDMADLMMTATVTEANKVTVVLANIGATDPTDLGSGTLYVRVFKRF
jgi:hypothetical protein